jgi:transposase
MRESAGVEARLKDIERRTRRKFSSEEKIRIVLEGIRGETSIADLCRREGIHANQYYTWSKEFLEAGKQRLSGNIVRQATSPEVDELRKENAQLKAALADVFLKNQILKKSLHGLEAEWDQ